MRRRSAASHLGFDSSWQEIFINQSNESSQGPGGSSSHYPVQGHTRPTQQSVIKGVTSELYHTLNCKKERRARTHPVTSRLEPKVMFGEDFPPVDLSLTRSGFRPGSRHPYFQKNEHPLISTSYRYGNPKDYGAPLSSISGSNNSTSTLQGYRVGITSREKQTSKSTPSRNLRHRNGSSISGSLERSKGYPYPDASSGAGQTFQQRLIEIANLEGDTIRYEKTRKVKKKAKQEK